MNRRNKHGFRLSFVLTVGFLANPWMPALRTQAPNKDESSCHAFVQQFYDWYINPYVQSGNGLAWYDVARLKPQILGPELLKLLRKEDKTQESCKCIDHLDADPFVNSQDPDQKYVVTNVVVTNGKCIAIVKGASEVRPELMRTSQGWTFLNFHYSFYSEDGKRKLYPDDDLISMLRR